MKLVLAVVEEGYSYRPSANQYEVSKSTLSGRVKRHKKSAGLSTYFSNFNKQQVYITELEAVLAECLLNFFKNVFGLSPKATRQLANEYAISNYVHVPES